MNVSNYTLNYEPYRFRKIYRLGEREKEWTVAPFKNISSKGCDDNFWMAPFTTLFVAPTPPPYCTIDLIKLVYKLPI